MHKRREFEVFTLSFLDCICCGFGAIILLLVLTDVGQPIVIERSERDLKGQIDALQRQFQFRLQDGSRLQLLAYSNKTNNKKLTPATDSARAGGGESAH